MGCKSHFPEKELINLGLAEVLGVDFFVNKLDLQLDKIPAGHLIIIKKSENGRTLHREKKTKRSFRISCRLLVGSLKQKGVPLPARYRLEWSEKMQAWVGRIV